MAEWQSFVAADMLPTEMISAISTVESTAQTLGTSLDLAADIVDLVALFVQGVADVNATLIAAAQDLIESVTQQLLGTGVFMLNHIPATPSLRVNPQIWLQEVANSLNDTFDTERPILNDPGAFVGAIVIMGTGPDYRQLMIDFKSLFDLFKATVAELLQISKMKLPGEEPEVISPGVGQVPDWKSTTIAELVPEIGEIAKQLVEFSKFIESAKGASVIYSRYANVLRNKANALRGISSRISTTVAALTAALLQSGAYLLPIYGQMDKAGVQQQLLTSTGGPLALGDSQFAAGFMFLSTGGTTTPRDILFDLFDVAKVNT